MHRRVLAVAAAMLITGGIAQAADVKAPVARPVAAAAPFSWTGFYIGVHGGGAWANSSSANVSPFGGFDAGGVSSSYSLDSSGFMGGGQIGFNWQAGNIVFGVEGDIGYLGLDQQVFGVGIDADDFARVDFGWYGTITGRLGFAVDRFLIYVKGGGAWARITNEAGDLDFVPLVIDPTDLTSISKTQFGWALGGGVEWAFAPNWSVKAEYLYMDFGTERTTNLEGDFYDHRNDVHTVKLGLNYRFGFAAAPVVARY